MSVVLMYHALYRDGDVSMIDPVDLPYAVAESDFIAQIDLLANRSVGLFDDNHLPDIVITFDDGHQSNLEIAAPLLMERKIPAYFFISSDFIGNRAGFMSPDQLRALSDLPGMCIGSHGVTHRFFDDLNESDSKQELVDSRMRLETITHRDCRSISFPGGRYNDETLRQLAEAGYVQWFGSEIGIVNSKAGLAAAQSAGSTAKCTLRPQVQDLPLERIAVRRSTQQDEFARMIEPDEAYYQRHRRRRQMKNLVRRALGNRLYHGLYKSLSTR